MRTVVRLVSCALLLSLAGCGGGGADAKLEATTVSQGQQLLDLQKARDAGAISDSEYEKQKSKVLNR